MFWEVHPAQQLLKAGVVAQAVENRIYADRNHVLIPHIVRLLQPGQGFVGLPGACIERTDSPSIALYCEQARRSIAFSKRRLFRFVVTSRQLDKKQSCDLIILVAP